VLFLLATTLKSSTTIESKWDAGSPIFAESFSSTETINEIGAEFGIGLWFKYYYRIPQKADVSLLVNNDHSIAGLARDGSYSLDGHKLCDGFGITLPAFGEGTSPKVRFSARLTDGECGTIDFDIGTDEIDGSWNFVYAGVKDGNAYLVVKGSNSDI